MVAGLLELKGLIEDSAIADLFESVAETIGITAVTGEDALYVLEYF